MTGWNLYSDCSSFFASKSAQVMRPTANLLWERGLPAKTLDQTTQLLCQNRPITDFRARSRCPSNLWVREWCKQRWQSSFVISMGLGSSNGGSGGSGKYIIRRFFELATAN